VIRPDQPVSSVYKGAHMRLLVSIASQSLRTVSLAVSLAVSLVVAAV